MKSFDYIYQLDALFDKNSEKYNRLFAKIYQEEKRKGKSDDAIRKKVDKEFFKDVANGSVRNINACYIPFFLNIGKDLTLNIVEEPRRGTEKEVYKNIFSNGLRENFKKIFKDSKSFMDGIVNFEEELKNIKLLKTKWAIIRCEFVLEEVYFSRDDTFFYVIDNPLKKDKVFKIPYIAPSTWKGMLRWVATKLYGKTNKDRIKRIFGFEKGGDEEENAGALRIYPSFFYDIDIEIINPIDRKTRKGTVPILFEVVPKGSKSEVILTYIPNFIHQQYIDTDLEVIQGSLEVLIRDYGISAKRSSGWGKAKIKNLKIERG